MRNFHKKENQMFPARSNCLRTHAALAVLLPLSTACFAAPKAEDAPIATGSLHGTVTTGSGAATAHAKVAVCSVADYNCSYTLTDFDGSYAVPELPAGSYQVAVMEDHKMLGTVVLDVTPGSNAVANVTAPDPQEAAKPAATPAAPPLDQSFMHKFGRAYVADWSGNGPGTAITQAARRGTPAPLFSPPYPAGDWPIGGTVVIGAPDTQTYPLMQAIDGNKSANKIYGWIEIGGNASTNNKSNAAAGIAANVPAAYDVYSNQIQLDQAAVYFERIENTAQTDHFDWGYRVTLLYGTDYRFTTSHGYLSQQLLVKNAEYGFDPVMVYYDAYLPKLGQGSVLRIGRYISLPDIEAQLAPNNYSYSHSILYTYDCYTQTGANLTTKINDNWTVQAGISAGCDTAPWTTDAKLTGNFCATFTWHNGGDALNTCDNSVNDSKYAYNNLTAYYETWYHRFNATWHTDTEGWYQYMKDVPNMYWFNSGGKFANTARTPYPETNGAGVNLNFGAVCQNPNVNANLQSARCFAPEWAIVNYVEHNFWHNSASINIRNEVVDDIKGQRSGTPAIYEEHMVGFDFWAGSTITFRPDLSYTKCYSKYTTPDGKPVSCTDISAGSSIASDESQILGNGTIATGRGKTASLTLAADLIWHF
jgi:hypothetical protein